MRTENRRAGWRSGTGQAGTLSERESPAPIRWCTPSGRRASRSGWEALSLGWETRYRFMSGGGTAIFLSWSGPEIPTTTERSTPATCSRSAVSSGWRARPAWRAAGRGTRRASPTGKTTPRRGPTPMETAESMPRTCARWSRTGNAPDSKTRPERRRSSGLRLSCCRRCRRTGRLRRWPPYDVCWKAVLRRTGPGQSRRPTRFFREARSI